MIEAPIRDVVRVEERVGPRGGRTLVLHLSCGCFLTRSSKAPPPKRARCIPCSVLASIHPVDPLANATMEERQQLGQKIALAARERAATRDQIAENLVLALRGMSAGTARECILVALRLHAATIAAEVERHGATRTWRKYWGASARSNSRPNDA